MSELPEVINWRRLNDRITLSGQPTVDQLSELSKLGVTHIINLGPHTNKGALTDEAGTVAALGMTYIYIPVDFDNPTDKDFSAFCDALERAKNDLVHIHCIYNARVTAFTYRHAKVNGVFSEARTFSLMDGIWRPGGVWARFIGDDGAVNQPNLYAGDDY